MLDADMDVSELFKFNKIVSGLSRYFRAIVALYCRRTPELRLSATPSTLLLHLLFSIRWFVKTLHILVPHATHFCASVCLLV
jgi:hypothetical protein